jgi:dTDP-4-dehydrorhamnose 3,5-epimerase
MILETKNFEISGVKLFSIKSYEDNRGSFSEFFLSKLDYPEFKIEYIQENESISNFGVFRGMHFQKGKNSQSKLIRVIKGKIIDVICDLRKSSPSFKKIIFIELNTNQLLFLPKGVAHGFLSLEEGTILNYKCDSYYNYNSESGFNLFKSKVKIDFPLLPDDISMSNKDKSLTDLDNSYIYEEL